MKKKIRILSLIGFVALAALLVVPQLAAAAKGVQVKKATGPFTYTEPSPNSHTFLGQDGTSIDTTFNIYAPGPVDAESFPSSPKPASAEVRVFGIERVADADGNPLDPYENIPLNTIPGSQIANAFHFGSTPFTANFYPGTHVQVDIDVYNPNVDEEYYGEYIVTIKAQSTGSGIGVGSGARFRLTLKAPSVMDNTPPVVTITVANNPHILGPVDITVTANDPTSPSNPGTGVASVSASIKSLGSGFAVTSIALGPNDHWDPPVTAGNDAVATGQFMPIGGSGPAGTSTSPFTASSLSGIGKYEITATATDGAGNIGTQKLTLTIIYDTDLTSGHAGPTTLKFTFPVRRLVSATFMHDQTVVVELYKKNADNSFTLAFTHTYGTADVKEWVQIKEADGFYETHFAGPKPEKGSYPGLDAGIYKAKVFFQDVDDNDMYLLESGELTIPKP